MVKCHVCYFYMYQISLGIAFIKITLPPIKCIEIIQHVFHVTVQNLVFTPNSLLFTNPNSGKQGYFKLAAL